MRRIPLISPDPSLAESLTRIVDGVAPPAPEIITCPSEQSALEFLDVEMPDLALIHFSGAAEDADRVLEALRQDPWLVSGGVVALCDDEDRAEELHEDTTVNWIAVLEEEQLDRQLPRVVEILRDNRRMLFQREIGANLGEFSGSFELRNDPLDARVYANLVCNFLFNAGRVGPKTRAAVNLAIFELLVNAMEHGNCGISYEEKSEWLEQHRSTEQLLAQRAADPAIAARRVHFEYTIHPDRSSFFIADEGEGFDWRERRNAASPENLLTSHGRGIMIAESVTEGLEYNEKGNEVRFDIVHRTDEGVPVPAFAEGIEPREIAAGETVYREDDASELLYYIAKGQFEHRVDGHPVARMTPDDMFLGEISFLLNKRRRTTVVALTDGKLVEIPRRLFVRAVKENPHYSMQFARMLARKIDQRNQLAAERLKRDDA